MLYYHYDILNHENFYQNLAIYIYIIPKLNNNELSYIHIYKKNVFKKRSNSTNKKQQMVPLTRDTLYIRKETKDKNKEGPTFEIIGRE